MTFKELMAICRMIEEQLEDAKFDRKMWDEKLVKGEFTSMSKESVEKFRAEASIKVSELSRMLQSIADVEVFR